MMFSKPATNGAAAMCLAVFMGAMSLGVGAQTIPDLTGLRALTLDPIPSPSEWGLVLLALMLDVGILWFAYVRPAVRRECRGRYIHLERFAPARER